MTTHTQWLDRLAAFVAEAGRMPQKKPGEADLYLWVAQTRAGYRSLSAMRGN